MTPELAFWFGVRPWEIDDLTFGEVEEFHRRLSKLPPIGAVFMVERK